MLPEMQTEVFHRLDPYSGQALAMTDAKHWAMFGKAKENPASLSWFNIDFNFARNAHPDYFPFYWKHTIERLEDHMSHMLPPFYRGWFAGLAERNDLELSMQYVKLAFQLNSTTRFQFWEAIYGTNNYMLVKLVEIIYGKWEGSDYSKVVAIIGSRFAAPGVTIIKEIHEGHTGRKRDDFCLRMISVSLGFRNGKMLAQCVKHLTDFDAFIKGNGYSFMEACHQSQVGLLRSLEKVTLDTVEYLQCLVDMKEIYTMSDSQRTHLFETIAFVVAADEHKIPHLYEALRPLVKELSIPVSLT